MSYEEFLASKAIVDKPSGIASPRGINKILFPFQQACVKWGLQRGRAGQMQGTGLGKSFQESETSRIIEDHEEKAALIIAPLAVSHQTILEAKKLGTTIRFAESQDDVAKRGIYITNYQKIDKFDPRQFSSVALDEASILKSVDGSIKEKLIRDWTVVPYRSAWSATPAPNDYMELGNQAEFLGVMTSSEMMSTFFVHDGGETQKWRLKGHAEQDFWRWMASWSICISHPRDIGFDQQGYDLPPLYMHEVVVDCDAVPLDGELFAMPARTLQERRGARKATISQRVAKCKEIMDANADGSPWLIWAGLNDESKAIAKMCGISEVTGSDSDESKENTLLDFALGKLPGLVSKVEICGFGMNLQVCHNMIFCGLSDSFEKIYQAVRRAWRFGQTSPVNIWMVISSQEGEVLRNIKRKERDAIAMQQALVGHMANFTKAQLTTKSIRQTIPYKPCQKLKLPAFLK